ncbi:hypothetical protein ACSBOB_07690 [Mesorhizobium sp. ASY16-5R]|uniref:hypothetical protein n=1 Tax=Mesorhizobium sp. ASY16-5R TaxID=3445772 RepID=UPI003F9F4758
MAATSTARPVSGEIMTGPLRRGGAGVGRGVASDIVEAEFEIVGDREPLVPPEMFQPRRDAGMAFLAGSAAVATPPGLFARRGGAFFWAGGLAMVCVSFWVSGGYALVLPQGGLSSGDAGPAFTLSDISSRVDDSGPRPVLFVDGHAGNDGAAGAAMPGLEIRVASLDGTVTRYKLGTSSRRLDPGESFAFSSRLDVPRNGVKSVSVTFAE